MNDIPTATITSPDANDDASRRLGPCAILAWAVGVGLVAGGLELVAMVLKCAYFDPRNTNLSRHYPWMFPTAGVLVELGPGLVLALWARLSRRGLPVSAAIGVLSFVAYLGVAFRLPVFTVACLLLAMGAALQTARLAQAHPRGAARLLRWSLAPLVLLLVATMAGSSTRPAVFRNPAPAGAPPSAKNVLLIVLDTVRAQSLSLYGYERDTSPNLRRFAARGVRFDSALATAPWTAPSHASIFTGRWPHELSVGWSQPLDGAYPTLAGFLSARGYRTAGFVANTTYCSYETGLDRGFAHYEDYDVTPRTILLCSAIVQRTLNAAVNRGLVRPAETKKLGSSRKDAARINGDFLDWLPSRGDAPFFAFLNYYDAHHPYLSPDDRELSEWGGRLARSDADHRLLRTWWDHDKRRLTPADLELVRDSYDRCLAYLDGQVGRLLDELSRRGILDQTIVIITADHGEHLGEQALFGHGCSLYRPELHVPLLILAPGAAPKGRVVTDPVSLRDVPSTVVDLLGLSAESPFPGRSLAQAWSNGTSPGPLLSEIDLPPEADPNGGRSPVCRGAMVSLVSGGWHYIKNGDGREELYDFAHDPAEEHDLAGSEHGVAVVREMRDRVRR